MTTIANVLTNPTYMGVKEINRDNRGKDQSKLPEDARYRTVPGVWEPIISPEQFERVQALRAKNARAKRSIAAPVQHNFLLHELLVCDYCGEKLQGSHGTGRNGTRYYPYRHRSRRSTDPRPANKCPLWRSIPAEQVERLVLERLAYLGNHIEIVEEIVAEAAANFQSEVPQVLRRLHERQKRLAELEQQSRKLLDLATEMPLTQQRTFLEPRLAEIQTEKKEAEGEAELLEQSVNELKGNAVSAVDLQKAIQTFDALFAELAPHEQRELLRYLIEEARMSRDFMVIRLHGKASAEQIGVEKQTRRPGFVSGSPRPRYFYPAWTRTRNKRTKISCVTDYTTG